MLNDDGLHNNVPRLTYKSMSKAVEVDRACDFLRLLLDELFVILLLLG